MTRVPVSGVRSEMHAARDEVGEQFGVVVDRLVEAELRILVAQRVQRVRVGGEDRLELRVAERAHVLLDQQLEQPLLADPAHVVAGVALALVEQPERHAGVVEDPRDGLRGELHALVEGGEVADEPDVLHGLLARVRDLEVEALGPAGAHAR